MAQFFLCRFCVTLTFLIVYIQAAEVFPTQLRSTGSGFASTVSSVMSVGGPYMIFLVCAEHYIQHLSIVQLCTDDGVSIAGESQCCIALRFHWRSGSTWDAGVHVFTRNSQS